MKLNQEQAKGTVIIIGGIAAVVIIFFVVQKFFGGLQGLLEALGLKSDKEESEAEKSVEDARDEANSVSSPWSPAFWKSYRGEQLLLKTEAAKEYSVLLFNSVGFFYDTAPKAVGVIKQLKTKSQVSFLADVFQQTYKRDLFDFLYTHFDTGSQKKSMENIVSYVDSLPAYKP